MAWSNPERKRTFQTWSDMKQRCLNQKAVQFKNYGARGIKVCSRWIDSFDNFISDMGVRPDGLTLDRINCNGDYSPMNCRWASVGEQNSNQRRSVYLEKDGVRLTIAEWARKLGRHPATIGGRIRKGYPITLALSVDSLPSGRGSLMAKGTDHHG